MKAQIIVVGDELLIGRIQDTNTQLIAKWLYAQGFELTKVSIIGDQPAVLLSALKNALKCCDLILTTGGLGPTRDDITKSVMAELSGDGRLIEDDEAAKLAKLHYQRMDKEWTKETNSYHYIPQGMRPVENPAGLAPGLSFKTQGKLLLSAPGVPRELQAMLEGPFIELLDDCFPKRANDQQIMTIRTFGMPEEKIFFEELPHLWDELSLEGKVSSLPQILGVDIHLSFRGDKADLLKKTQLWKDRLQDSPLADYIWSYEYKSVEEVVLERAREKDITIGLAESCTGGLVAHRLTNIPGSSSHFRGSVVAYANEIKRALLGVKEETLKAHGAVSIQTAQEMAEGTLKAMKADVAVALTGIAGPGGGSPEKPVGTVCIGQAHQREGEGEASAKLYHYRGDRNFLKRRFSEIGLHNLRRTIAEL